MPRIRILHTPEVETQPEAEGHMPMKKFGHTPDAEGHMPIKRTLTDAEDEDDSAGHMPLKKSYAETPPPSAIGQHGQPTDPV